MRVAILGASGIGYVHARLYNKLGAAVTSIMCRSDIKAKQIASDLLNNFGIVAKPFSDINRIFEEELDAVSICTPPALHLEQIIAALDRKIPVFCEKPLFWNENYRSIDIIQNLKILKEHPNRKIFVNTSNTVFIDTISKNFGKVNLTKNFNFEFFTNGQSEGLDIAIDLFPHGLSLLLHIFGECEISKFSWKIKRNNFFCQFVYGGCYVNFDFREDVNGPRHLLIGLDDKKYKRIQEGRDASYKVHLKDEDTNEIIPSQDPFEIYLSEFINFCSKQEKQTPDNFYTASLNMKLMATCLKLINQKV